MNMDFDLLPSELVIDIFRCLPTVDRIRLERVCRSWERLLRNETWNRCYYFFVNTKWIFLDRPTTDCCSCDKVQISRSAVSAILMRMARSLTELEFTDLCELSICELIAGFRLCHDLHFNTTISICVAHCVMQPGTAVELNKELNRLFLPPFSVQKFIFVKNELLQNGCSSRFSCLFLDSTPFALKHLWLEEVNLPKKGRSFTSLCMQLAPTLEYFAYKEDNCAINSTYLASGIQCLNKLLHLNLGGRTAQHKPASSSLTNSALRSLTGKLCHLQAVSFRGSNSFSMDSMADFIDYAPNLTLVNLNRCSSARYAVSELSHIAKRYHLLQVYTYGTNKGQNHQNIDLSNNIQIVVRLEDQDESIVWGDSCFLPMKGLPYDLDDDSSNVSLSSYGSLTDSDTS